MFDRKLLALGALAGVAYGLLEVAGVIVGGTSNPPSSSTTFRPPPRLPGPQPPCSFVFVIRASAAVQAADAQGLIARSSLVAGAINVGLVFASLGVMAARYLGGGHGLDGQGVITLAYLALESYVMSWPAMGIFLGALAAGALRTPWSTGPRPRFAAARPAWAEEAAEAFPRPPADVAVLRRRSPPAPPGLRSARPPSPNRK